MRKMAAKGLAYRATEPEELLRDTWDERGIDPEALICDPSGTIQPKSTPRATTIAAAESSDGQQLQDLPLLISSFTGDESQHLEMSGVELGRGAMGVVHSAKQIPMKRDVAVKTLLSSRPELDERFQVLREARVTGVLEHPNVVPVYMLGVDSRSVPVIVMKHISGTLWSDYIDHPDKLSEQDEPDPFDWHLRVLMQVCNAVHYAHSKGILHRDLKPDNVMLGEFGEVYVLDWGLAVSLDDDSELGLSHVRAIDCVAGTPNYMSPEMVLADGDLIGIRSDVYLLGAILHEVVTSELRHQGETVMEALRAAVRSQPYDYDDGVPRELAEICNKATARDPAERYEHADELRHAVGEFLTHRHAARLCAEAHTRLERLRDVLEYADPDDEDQTVQIYRIFGECQFAYRQAQREHEDNLEAREGLQELLEMLAHFELDGADYKAAVRLVRDLPVPSPALDRRLALLRDNLDEELAQVESLRDLGHKADKSIGRRERALIMAAMGVIWAAFYFGLGHFSRTGRIGSPHEVFMLVNTVYGVFLFAAMRRWRETLWETDVNKRFVWTLWAAFLVAAVFWLAAWSWDMPFGRAIAITQLLYGAIVWMSASTIDIRLVWATVPYLIGFVGAAAAPAYAWEAIGLSTVGAMATAAAVWRPK
jgi:serine/threonine protein kinase